LSQHSQSYLVLDGGGAFPCPPAKAVPAAWKKGALKPTRIGGRLVFKQAELDRVLEKGDEVRGSGSLRKNGE